MTIFQQALLNAYCSSRNFTVVAELTLKKNQKRPDGIIKDDVGLDWGYWEAKNPEINLDQAMENKFRDGYPNDNILFENSQIAILIQGGQEVSRVNVKNPDQLHKIITQFFEYERPEVKDFRQAISSFKQDLPTILDTLRNLINPLVGWAVSRQDNSQISNYLETAHLTEFKQEFNAFLKLCQESINPQLNSDDIREMIIQHILTEDIFINIFQEGDFHRENNIAKSLQKVIETFFTGTLKKNTFKKIENYYSVIIRTAANLTDYHEKQQFLKKVYEEFYQGYNPLAADRLGIVYTPNEIVNFMVESTDYLLHKHFNKLLGDRGVEILDPATGTGTFITALLDYLPSHQLKYKYLHEIHCNEVSILPYYIANLNIEYTYQQLMGEYELFENICLVDTLDNTSFENKQMDMFSPPQNTPPPPPFKGGLGGGRQNDRKISVIIGNPPYNANQQNENDNNKNREYPAIDKRIKDTYIKESTAQKTKVYDMYARFLRWASDRISDNGIIAFITNNSFINARTFDGFRKVVQDEFDYIYVIDLGGDIRGGDKSGNVFNIMVGVAIIFFVKKSDSPHPLGEGLGVREKCQIFYNSLTNLNSGQEKLQFLASHKFAQIHFEHIQPDDKNNWINLTDNDFDSLLPLVNKETKLAKNKAGENAIFKIYSLGLATNRDEWVYDFNETNLVDKIKFFCDIYKKEQQRWFSSNKTTKINDFVSRKIKWTSELEQHLIKGSDLEFNQELIIKSIYRPYVIKNIYFDRIIVHRFYQQDSFFPLGENKNNLIIAISGSSSSKNFQCLATKTIVGLDFLEKTQCLPLYRYENGERIDNITDWGLQQFRDYYQPSPPQPPSLSERGGRRISDNSSSPHPVGEGLGVRANLPTGEGLGMRANLPTGEGLGVRANLPTGEGLGMREITKLDIFHYIYAVLHNPKYRETYQLNLKRDFPRIPFYDDFNQWKNWGEKLMDLHLNYETITPYPLTIINVETLHATSLHSTPKPKLKADKTKGQIIIDEITTLTNIPEIAWEYQLGNRSALEWILDQYKEKKPKDSTIAEKFNNYRFSDYKETVIDLLKKVTTVSIETMKIINSMNN